LITFRGRVELLAAFRGGGRPNYWRKLCFDKTRMLFLEVNLQKVQLANALSDGLILAKVMKEC
jgi:hypothetical protein